MSILMLVRFVFFLLLLLGFFLVHECTISLPFECVSVCKNFISFIYLKIVNSNDRFHIGVRFVRCKDYTHRSIDRHISMILIYNLLISFDLESI